METLIMGVILSPERKFVVPGGDVFHAVKRSSEGFNIFGEAYFSFVKSGVVKGWRKHSRITLNLVVPVGAIRFILYDDREGSTSRGAFLDVTLSPENYLRLVVPPKIWMSFRGVSDGVNMLLDITDEEYSVEESVTCPFDEIPFPREIKP